MRKPLRRILLACLVVSLSFSFGCGNQNETPAETKGDTVETVMQNHTTIEIGDVSDEAETEVIITTPDLTAIYMDLLSKNPDTNMSADEIAKVIAEYAKNKDYLVTSKAVTAVEKDGNDWKLASDECIDEAIRNQVNNLMIQMINGIGTIEVDDISEDLE